MDFDSTNLYEILLDGEEDLDSGHGHLAGNSGIHTLLQDHPYGRLPNKPEDCPAVQLQRLPDDDPEGLFQLRIDPNEVYHPRSSETAGDVSPRPRRDPLPPGPSPTVVLEVVCDPGNWEDPNLLGAHPPTCIASQASPGFLEGAAHLNAAEVPTEEPPALFLTEDERSLLSQEGVLLRDAVHLSQAEEQILKKIRRKIRNKQSAQDSRRRKKEYLDGLETRVAACSAQNQDLKRKVQLLEKRKESLLDQLQKLQGLLTQPPSKAVQTSTCLGILLVSFGLFLWPTCAAFYGASQVGGENPEPSGVLSRNILTQKGPPEPGTPPAARHPKEPRAQAESPLELRTRHVGKDPESHLVAGETAREAGSEPQTQLKDRRRGKATRPDLDEI
ncbi:cyclic AMP-responsive element-binding protein 3-like protein 4 isoform X2 [Pseudonaja textilis]|uniref:cyclic AMP-responsive element-binding protein 3-like protein 4 isoform X2 n=1 Tax=Pseudonaja textilis TaxID=8673 RepID=UPI000EA9A9A4|nr:cyclic AMP-responsive element-binding protein 3-like protein 4 isoform X2 [Pseudonaja textilis]